MTWLSLSEDPEAQFTEILIETANKTIPKPHISKVPWFSMIKNKLLENAGKLNKSFFHNPSIEDVPAFKQLKAQALSLIHI